MTWGERVAAIAFTYALRYVAYLATLPAVFLWAFTLFWLLAMLAVAVFGSIHAATGSTQAFETSLGFVLGLFRIEEPFHYHGDPSRAILRAYAYASFVLFVVGELCTVLLKRDIFAPFRSVKRWVVIVSSIYAAILVLGFVLLALGRMSASPGWHITMSVLLYVATLLATLVAYGVQEISSLIISRIE